MRAAAIEALEPLALSILQKHGVMTENHDPAYFRAALAIVKEKIKLGRELPEWMSYFFREDFEFDPAAAKKVFTPEGLANIGKLRERLAGLDDKSFTSASLETEFKTLAAATGQKVGALIHPARLAVSGRPVGPSLYHLLEVLGKDRVLSRLERAEKQPAIN
jgi:glutamyl-tRNA synthetase